MIELSVYSLLAVVEVALILVAGLGLALYRLRRVRRELGAGAGAGRTRVQIEQVAVARDSEKSYAGYLQEEIERGEVLLGQAAPAEGEADAGDEALSAEQCEVRDMLGARQRFLGVELGAQQLGADPEAQRKRLVEGMRGLLDELGAGADSPAAHGEGEADGAGTAAASGEATESGVDASEIDHLRTMLDAQHDLMAELRADLLEHAGESEHLQAVLRKLDQAEEQTGNLRRMVCELQEENTKLRIASSRGPGVTVDPQAAYGIHRDGEDVTELKSALGDQRETIDSLQGLLQEALPEAEKAKALEQAIAKIQRSNADLGNCLTVLEDENDRLRQELDQLKAQMDSQEGAGEEASPPAPGDVAAGERQVQVPAGEALDLGAEEDVDAVLEQAQAEAQPEAAAASPEVAAAGAAEVAPAEQDVDAVLEQVQAEARPEPAAAPPEAQAASATDAAAPAEQPAGDQRPALDAVIDELLEADKQPASGSE